RVRAARRPPDRGAHLEHPQARGIQAQIGHHGCGDRRDRGPGRGRLPPGAGALGPGGRREVAAGRLVRSPNTNLIRQAMATTNDLKNGLVLNLDGDLWSVVEFQHVKPGKGGAFVRTTLKNVLSGKVVDKTFNAGTKVDTATVDKRTMQYL